jgi:hypothetical protein
MEKRTITDKDEPAAVPPAAYRTLPRQSARLSGIQVITDDSATVLREGALMKLGGALSNKWNARW